MKEIQADRVWADGQSRGLAHVPAAEENLRADHVRGAACLGPGGDPVVQPDVLACLSGPFHK